MKNDDEVKLTLKPGAKGTLKLMALYGHKLVCIRYRYNKKAKHRYKTIELIIDQIFWKPKKRKTN